MVGQNGKRQGLQGIARQDGCAFIEGLVYGGLATTQVVVIHGGQVVVDQRVGVDQLDGRRGGVQGVVFCSQGAPRQIDQQRAQALAAHQQAVAHGCLQARLDGGPRLEQRRQGGIDAGVAGAAQRDQRCVVGRYHGGVSSLSSCP